MSLKDLEQILRGLGRVELIHEIELDKKGKYIHQQIENKGYVGLKVFIEWLDIVEKFEKINIKLEDKFNALLLETYQSFARYKLDPQAKLSEIFKFLESKKEELDIGDDFETILSI